MGPPITRSHLSFTCLLFLLLSTALLFTNAQSTEEKESMSLAEPVTTTPPTSTTPVISSTSTTTSSPAATSSAAVNNTDPITVVLANCSFGHTYCSKVQSAAETAAAELAQVVNIKVGITQVSISISLSLYSCILIQSEYSVKLEYFSFCDRSCANDTYGFGVPGSQVS